VRRPNCDQQNHTRFALFDSFIIVIAACEPKINSDLEFVRFNSDGIAILAFSTFTGRGKKIWWNEKFRFSLSAAECRELAKVTLTVMERDKFSQDTAVGETRYE
jgi:hypothetical protein